MGKLFVEEKTALNLKEKGFIPNPILGLHGERGDIEGTAYRLAEILSKKHPNLWCPAILYQQATNWLFEEHNLKVAEKVIIDMVMFGIYEFDGTNYKLRGEFKLTLDEAIDDAIKRIP